MLIYKGLSFIPGVPARDLSVEEVKIFGEKRLLASGLYSKPKIMRRHEAVKEDYYDKWAQGITSDSAE